MTATPPNPTAESPADGSTDPVVPETTVPADEEPAARCPYCSRPFRREHHRDLHVGSAHETACTDAERAAHEAATETESDDLFYYHLKVVAGLTIIYAMLVLVYMVVLGTQ